MALVESNESYATFWPRGCSAGVVLGFAHGLYLWWRGEALTAGQFTAIEMMAVASLVVFLVSAHRQRKAMMAGEEVPAWHAASVVWYLLVGIPSLIGGLGPGFLVIGVLRHYLL